MAQTFSQTDTSNLIAASLTGKGLKSNRRADLPQQSMQSQPQQVQQKPQSMYSLYNEVRGLFHM